MDEEFLTAAEASKKLWPTNRQACWFLIWYGLLVMPLCCAAGHQWKSFNSNSDKGNLFLHCTERIPNPDFHSDDEDDDVPRKKLCNKKMTWRRPGTLPNYLGNNFKPAEYLASLYWFASDSSYKAARKQAGVSMKNWRGFATKIRGILRLSVARFSSAQLGGDGRIVCVDETFLTKKKHCKGGFRGRATAGTKKIVLGMLELDLSTRKATGRCLLVEIPDRTARTLQLYIRRHIVAGSLVFTDKFKSYQWMSKPNSGFVHRAVNHKQREFSRRETVFGKEVVVSTNAAEGLFGRLKAWMRTKAAKKVSSNSYGGLLAEFLWTASCSARKVDPFADLLQEILFRQEHHPNREKHDPSLKDSIPETVLQDFRSVCQAAPPPPDLVSQQQAAQAAPPPPELVAQQQAVAPEVPPLAHRSDSESEVELVCVRPAKRARATVKVETLLKNVLPVKQEGVKQEVPVKQEAPAVRKKEVTPTVSKIFCPQGHELILKPLGTSTSSKKVGRKEVPLVHWDEMTCDWCGISFVAQHTWRCDLCDWDVCEECESLRL